MSDRDQASARSPWDGDRPALVLICSSADASAVRQVENGLRERGYQVECIATAEQDEQRITEAVRARSGQGLYVVARSSALDARAVTLIRQVLRRERIPFGRVLEASITPGTALALENRIDSVARRMVTGNDTVIRERGRAIPGVAPSDDDELQDATTGVSHRTASTVAAVDTFEVDAWADSIIGKLPSEERETTSVDLVPFSSAGVPTATEASPSEALDVETTQPGAEAVEVTQSLHGGAGTPAYMPRDNTEIAPVLAFSATPRTPRAPKAEAVVTPRSGSADAEVRSASPGARARGLHTMLLGKRPLWLGAAAAVLAVSVGGTGVWLAGDENVPATADVAVEEPATANAPAAEEPAKAPVAAIAATPSAPSGAEKAAPAPARTDDARLIARALRDRKVRAWNSLLVASTTSSPGSFEHAAMHCAKLQEGKLSGWRMPSVGELNSLVQANLVKNGMFWSDTPGDAFGTTRLVLRPKKTKILAIEQQWDGGKAVCVRERS